MKIRRAPAGAALPGKAAVRGPTDRTVLDTEFEQAPLTRARGTGISTAQGGARRGRPFAVSEPVAGPVARGSRAVRAPGSPCPQGLFQPQGALPVVTAAWRPGALAVAPRRARAELRSRAQDD